MSGAVVLASGALGSLAGLALFAWATPRAERLLWVDRELVAQGRGVPSLRPLDRLAWLIALGSGTAWRSATGGILP